MASNPSPILLPTNNEQRIANYVSRPRLLILLNRLVTGGAAQDTLALAHALSDRYEILLLTGAPQPGEQLADYLLERYTGFAVERLPLMERSLLPLNDWKSYRAIRKIISRFRPHIVHTHGAKPGLLGRLAAWRQGVPVVVHTYHGHVFHSYFHPMVSQALVLIERWLARISGGLVVINQRLKDELVQQYRIAPAEKMHLIPLGIDADTFVDHDGSKRIAFRHTYGINGDTLAIGIVGRLVPVKQQSLFVEVALRILQNHASLPLRFFIVGDGPLAAALRKQIEAGGYSWSGPESNDLTAPFVFTSWQQDMPQVMAGLDIIMLTSLNEGTPVTLLEAMAAGKPVISTRVGGVAELIEEGETGFMAASAEGLSQALEHLISNPHLRAAMGARAFKMVRQRHSRKEQAKHVDAMYRQLLAEKG